MTITIKGALRVPHWDTLETLVIEALKAPGNITRIARRDGGTNFTALGLYSFTFIPYRTPEMGLADGEHVHVVLDVGV